MKKLFAKTAMFAASCGLTAALHSKKLEKTYSRAGERHK